MDFNAMLEKKEEIPPYDIDVEQALLGVLLFENDRYFDVAGLVTEEDFAGAGHGRIFAAIAERVSIGRNASPISLKSIFENDPDLEDVGGADYLADISTVWIAFGHNAEEYAKRISFLAERRALLNAVSEAQASLKMGAEDHDGIRDNLIAALESKSESAFSKTKREVAQEVVGGLELPPDCYSSGLKKLDNVMAGGLYAGFTYALCGAEKRGKTTFAHTISENLNEQGVDHAYIALEMGSRQIEARNMARREGVNSLEFLKRDKNPDLIRALVERTAAMKDHTRYLDMPGCSFAQIKAELARLHGKKQIRGFILDYWQLVQGADNRQSKADFLYDVAQWCANWARRHGLFSVILSQVNRQGAVYASAGLEKACDQMFFIEKTEEPSSWTDADLWLKMTHSRYTPLCDVGSESKPEFLICKKAGPYIREAE